MGMNEPDYFDRCIAQAMEIVEELYPGENDTLIDWTELGEKAFTGFMANMMLVLVMSKGMPKKEVQAKELLLHGILIVARQLDIEFSMEDIIKVFTED